MMPGPCMHGWYDTGCSVHVVRHAYEIETCIIHACMHAYLYIVILTAVKYRGYWATSRQWLVWNALGGPAGDACMAMDANKDDGTYTKLRASNDLVDLLWDGWRPAAPHTTRSVRRRSGRRQPVRECGKAARLSFHGPSWRRDRYNPAPMETEDLMYVCTPPIGNLIPALTNYVMFKVSEDGWQIYILLWDGWTTWAGHFLLGGLAHPALSEHALHIYSYSHTPTGDKFIVGPSTY
jgi:hypothetical protein